MGITAKSFKSIVSSSKVNVNVDLTKDLEGMTPSQKTKLKNIVGETIISEIKRSTASKMSTVDSTKFQKLTKEYRKLKLSSGKGGQPNLRLTDSMIEDIFSKNSTSSIDIKITNSLSKKKAENHNHGKSKGTSPKRQFLPTKSGVGFKREIMKTINGAIRDFKKDIQ